MQKAAIQLFLVCSLDNAVGIEQDRQNRVKTTSRGGTRKSTKNGLDDELQMCDRFFTSD